ncbi:MAG: phosphotransferase [Planctomycetota bacterium]|nr:phosphotransferase [Planctomycetota bacterium]MDA1178377.1 phosphotransferase [Planctomycetota bacterium]
MNATASEFEQVLRRFQDELPSIIKNHSGQKFVSIRNTRMAGRRYSNTAFIEVDFEGGTRSFFLKQIINHPMNVVALSNEPDQAAIEYRMLEQLYPKFVQVEQCTVPRPVVLYSDANAYVTESIEARDLVNDLYLLHYFADRRQFDELQRHFYLSGRWLRHFQGCMTATRPGSEVANYMMQRCHDRLQVIDSKGRRWIRPEFVIHAKGYLDSLAARLNTDQMTVVPRHGDFGPWNALVNSEGITVIDFFGAGDGPLPEDLLSVLVFLDTMRYGLANSGSRVDCLSERFLAGFGAIGHHQPEYILLCEALQRLLQIAVAIQSLSGDSYRKVGWTELIERRRSLSANVAWFKRRPTTSSIWPI